MRLVIGLVFLSIGALHVWHVVGIDYGSVTDLNNTRFFSFQALDRLASSGPLEKWMVLSIDGAIAFLGVREMTRRRRQKNVSPSGKHPSQ
jgi:hypothetical protein